MKAIMKPAVHPIFVALLGITAVGGAIAWFAGSTVGPLAHLGVFIFVIAGWIVSLCLHEFGHAYTAWRFGDSDVAVRGYLTLNPLKYSNPLLSIGLPLLFIALGGIGLPGGAVYLQTSFMTKRQQAQVSLAGPAANLFLAVALLVPIPFLFDPEHGAFWSGVAFLAFLQITALLLNLIPIPGLDGYGAIEPFLSYETRRAVEPAKQFGFLILFVLLITPVLNDWFFSLVFSLFELSGVSGGLASIGGQLTRFWSAWL